MATQVGFQRTVNEVRRSLRAAGADPSCVVRAGRPDDCWGFWAPSIGVVINPDLRGRALWIILLHEFGHALGLDHRRSGIMHQRPLRLGVDQRRPTRAEKEGWVREIAEAARKWRQRTLTAAKLTR